MRLDNFLALFRFYFPPYYPNTDFFHTGESCMSPVYHEKLYTPFYKIRHRRLRILCVIYANPFDVVKMIHVILLRGVAFHFNSFFGFACTYYLLVEENVNVSKLHSPLHFQIIHFFNVRTYCHNHSQSCIIFWRLNQKPAIMRSFLHFKN